jgi:hypothetical protein
MPSRSRAMHKPTTEVPILSSVAAPVNMRLTESGTSPIIMYSNSTTLRCIKTTLHRIEPLPHLSKGQEGERLCGTVP